MGLPFQQEQEWVPELTGETCTMLQSRTGIEQATGGKKAFRSELQLVGFRFCQWLQEKVPVWV